VGPSLAPLYLPFSQWCPRKLDGPLERDGVDQAVKGCCQPVEDATSWPPPSLRARYDSIGVLLLIEEEATREGAHAEVELDGLVPLTEVAENPVPQLEWKKGVDGP
jgi:hypothetical protein